MLAQIGVNRFNFQYSNLGAPSLTPGTSVVPGASNVEGSFTEIASAANIAHDIYFFTLWVYGGATASAAKSHLLDVGIDPAGGTSYVSIIDNIVCGASPTNFNSGITCLFFRFPRFIPAGSSVAVRIQGSNATAGTVFVVAEFFGQPSRPELVRTGQYAETIGTITSSQGVTFTPGTSGVEGAAWVSLGTTIRALWWWQLCVQVSDASMTGTATQVDLAYGDATNKVMIFENQLYVTTGGELVSGIMAANCFCEVPAGGEIFIRGSCSGTPDSPYNAVAVGIGG